MRACMFVWGGASWWGVGCSLIPEENVEEINLNYKDEASLESGSGRATEGSEGGCGGLRGWEEKEWGTGEASIITPVLFFFFCFLSFFSSSGGNEVACLPSSLACHPDNQSSHAHAQASYPISQSA